MTVIYEWDVETVETYDDGNNDVHDHHHFRKYPRTLQEAFGPYTSRDVLEQTGGKMHPHDKIILWACTVAVAVVGALVLVGVIV